MAVIQISRIQQRRGKTLQTGVPQLASGEFGWSVDTQELYIGNGSVAEGAPAVGNTRILTEHDNIFQIAQGTYTFKNPEIDTGSNINTGAPRTYQSKLDDFANARDFAANPDALVDITSRVQSAVNATCELRQTLYFPAGRYIVSGTIYLPPNTKIVGEGPGKTVIVTNSTGTIFQTVDGERNQLPNIISSGATPQHVHLQGLTLVSTSTNANPIVQLDCLNNSVVEDCQFSGAGPLDTSTVGIELRGQGAITCENIAIKGCCFNDLGVAIKSDYDIKKISVTDNVFGTLANGLDRGIVLAENLTGSSPQLIGPVDIAVSSNVFESINQEAIYVGPTPYGNEPVRSSNNKFNLVGNGTNQNEYTQVSDVITFRSFGNSSTDDSFGRLDQLNHSDLVQYNTIKPVISGPAFVNQRIMIPSLINGSGTYPLFAWPTSQYDIDDISSPGQCIMLNYFYHNTADQITRKGKVQVVRNSSTSTVSDSFFYSGSSDGGITFKVDSTRDDVTLVSFDCSGGQALLSCSVEITQ